MKIELQPGEELVVTLACPPERVLPVQISVIYDWKSLVVRENLDGELYHEELHRLEGWEHLR